MSRKTWSRHPREWIAAVDRGADPFRRLLLDPLLASMLATYPPGRALDLGCAEGSLSRELARRGWAVTGVDLEEDFVRVAADRGPASSFITADALRLPFGPGVFDLAVSKLASVSVSDYALFVAEAGRVLRPKGAFVDVVTHPSFATFPGDHRHPNRYLEECPVTVRFQFEGGTSIGPVTNYHRPLNVYVNGIVAAGLHVERIEEPQVPATLRASTAWRRTGFRGPPFLIIVARKP